LSITITSCIDFPNLGRTTPVLAARWIDPCFLLWRGLGFWWDKEKNVPISETEIKQKIFSIPKILITTNLAPGASGGRYI
jgi:hypothetical protein